MAKIALAIHGGAGTILKSQMTPELEQEYRGGLENALIVGWEILAKGGSALDVVEATVCSLEDFHLFNAGRGSVFTHDGKNEMDAAVMDGRTLDAGAVAFVKNVIHPIKLARLVMEKTPHILLAGDGAMEFAREMQVEFADDAYFFTEHRYEQLLKAREEGVVQLDHATDEPLIADRGSRIADFENAGPEGYIDNRNPERTETTNSHEATRTNPKSKIQNPKSVGTVGAVACD